MRACETEAASNGSSSTRATPREIMPAGSFPGALSDGYPPPQGARARSPRSPGSVLVSAPPERQVLPIPTRGERESASVGGDSSYGSLVASSHLSSSDFEVSIQSTVNLGEICDHDTSTEA